MPLTTFIEVMGYIWRLTNGNIGFATAFLQTLRGYADELQALEALAKPHLLFGGNLLRMLRVSANQMFPSNSDRT